MTSLVAQVMVILQEYRHAEFSDECPLPDRQPDPRNRSLAIRFDARLRAAGWVVQGTSEISHTAGTGIAVREYQTSIGPADYALFADKRALGVVEAKPDAWGERLTTVETQSSSYATAQLKWVKNPEPLPFVYEATGAITRFTDCRDPKPRSREGVHLSPAPDPP